MYILLGAVGLVLLLACVNVAGLLLARGATRHAELAVRASLGASRWRLVQQLLTESLALAVPGAALGVLLAWLSLDLLVAHVPLSIPSNSPAAINLTVLLGTMMLLVPCILISSLWPALRLSRVRVGAALAGGTRQASSPMSQRTGQVIIAVEVALAVVLVAGAGLMLRSFARLWDVDLGFDPQRIVTMRVLPLDKTPAVHATYYDRLRERARALPGVAATAVSDYFHLGSGMRTAAVRGAGAPEMVTVYRVSPDYFATIGATLVSGTPPSATPSGAVPPHAVINHSAARLLFPDEPAIGRTIVPPGPNAQPHTIVAIVADARNGGPTGSRTFYPAHVFFPFTVGAPDLTSAMTLLVRVADADAARGLAAELRRVAQNLGPRALVERIASGDELLDAGVVTPRKRTVMLGLLGGLGLVLALIGVVGVTASAVARRTREIGVRLAFGARPARVVATVLKDSAVAVVVGALAGVGGAAYATRAIASFLFETSPVDPMTLAVVTIGLVAAGVLAALWPALRASRIDPVSSLRAE